MRLKVEAQKLGVGEPVPNTGLQEPEILVLGFRV